jgi:DnaJ-class molecular chaperone
MAFPETYFPPEKKMKTCPKCEGTGCSDDAVLEDSILCKRCDGTGQVETDEFDRADEEMENREFYKNN